jgi:hypothetical protein
MFENYVELYISDEDFSKLEDIAWVEGFVDIHDMMTCHANKLLRARDITRTVSRKPSKNQQQEENTISLEKLKEYLSDDNDYPNAKTFLEFKEKQIKEVLAIIHEVFKTLIFFNARINIIEQCPKIPKELTIEEINKLFALVNEPIYISRLLIDLTKIYPEHRRMIIEAGLQYFKDHRLSCSN